MKHIDFYFDFLSPYSYLAWQKVKKMQRNISWSFYPVVLGQVIHAFNVKGPAEITPKREYLFRDCLRKAVSEKVVFKTPARLPFNSIGLLRMALSSVAKENQFRIIDIIYSAIWQKSIDAEDDQAMKLEFESNGLNWDELVANSSTPHARKELKENVKVAFERKIFGLPAFMFDGELFWGNDSVEYLTNAINGNDQYDRAEYNKFLTLSKKMDGEL